MGEEIPFIEAKAKKHKKWREEIEVNPIPWVGPNDVYYFVLYKINKRVKACAVLSKGEGSREEAIEAHKHLYLFYVLLENILADATDRSRIAFEFYTEPLKIIEEANREELRDGEELITSIYKKQLEFNEAYNSFFDHVFKMRDETKRITGDDVTFSHDSATRMNILQYLLLQDVVKHSTVLNEWIRHMKDLQLWKKLTKDQQIFYRELANNKSSLEDSLSGLDVTPADSYEELYKINRESSEKYNKEETKRQWDKLRYPK
ncbi:hypothetical protein [Jeotgalibacillus proteolyticus]|uniref:Uncharacterized protein n=1 Tax=Jeotgalibacillus proteolyticus TaxID=2082395 RepID=A0A2S5G6Q1_9BACL|nr:hypothetical protein [Jeotgalibacillus proteolyticus]PPA68657.1 hypothetical protein C4B60_20290 [Jeotgalibacillus proteolyticus]